VNRPARIGIVGDYNPEYLAHTTTDDSLRHVAEATGRSIESGCVPTESISPEDPAAALDRWDGIWISAGSPYRDRDGALAAIRFARERLRPMVAT
jgi:CTP synthase (UTP-ammonia lyase)